MTILQEREQQGIERGIELGELKRVRKSAKIGITKGYDINIIMDMTGLTEEEIEEIKEDMLKN